MKKGLWIACASVGLILGGFIVAAAVNCGQAFPSALNGYTAGCTIPSGWGNALEQKIGVTGSAVTSSLDYKMNHIPAAGVGSLANSSASGGIDFSAPTGTNITGILNSLALSQFTGNIVNSVNGATGTVSFGFVATNTGNWAGTAQGKTLGTISTFASTDYIPSSTSMVNTFNGATGATTYGVTCVSGCSVATTTTSTAITVTGGGSGSGSGNVFVSPTSTIATGSIPYFPTAASSTASSSANFTFTNGAPSTTANLYLGIASSTGCLKVREASDTAFSYVTFNNGTMYVNTATTTSCQ